MLRRNREINIFSMSALDLFASALGAFILITLILLPYYLKTEIKDDKTFLAIIIQWATTKHDIDLHVVDPAGAEFYYRQPTISGRPGELSKDTTNGPGVEIWQVPIAPKGTYKVFYNFYSNNGNPKKAIVQGNIYYRGGYKKFRNIILVNNRENLLVASVIVKDNGDVEIVE